MRKVLRQALGASLNVGMAPRLSATCMFAVMVAPMPRVAVMKFTFVWQERSRTGMLLSAEWNVLAQDVDECTIAEVALVLDEPEEAELICIRHINVR